MYKSTRESSLLFRLERGPGIALQAMQEEKALSSRGRGLMLVGIGGRRRRGRQRMRWLDGITNSMDVSLGEEVQGIISGEDECSHHRCMRLPLCLEQF